MRALVTASFVALALLLACSHNPDPAADARWAEQRLTDCRDAARHVAEEFKATNYESNYRATDRTCYAWLMRRPTDLDPQAPRLNVLIDVDHHRVLEETSSSVVPTAFDSRKKELLSH